MLVVVCRESDWWFCRIKNALSSLLVYHRSLSVLFLSATREGLDTGPIERVNDVGLPLQPVSSTLYLTCRIATVCCLGCGVVVGTCFAEGSMTRAGSPRVSRQLGELMQLLCREGGLVLELRWCR